MERYNRYQGNTGRVQRLNNDVPVRPRPSQPPAPPAKLPEKQRPLPAQRGGQPGIMEQLGKLLPRSLGQLETEDIILLLILYLLYRESGDSELLIIMGAMFLL